jgi:thiol-disulfide isomerase/thioredoxin
MFNLADTRGQVTVVKFAANYCVPCKATLPALADVARTHPAMRVIVVAEDEREQDAQALAQASGAGLPFVHDAGNVLSARYRVADLPTTFVLDKQGNVFWVGGANADERAIDAAVRNAEAR